MMNKEDIAKLESTLNVDLPDELVDKYTSSSIDELDDVWQLAAEGYLANPESLCSLFIRNPQTLIDLNQRLRKRGLFKKIWNPRYFAIGYDKSSSDYYFINLDDPHIMVYMANRSKTWRFDPKHLENNLLLPRRHGLDSYLDAYILSFIKRAKREKARKEAGIPERQWTTEDVYAVLEKLAKGESVDDYFK